MLYITLHVALDTHFSRRPTQLPLRHCHQFLLWRLPCDAVETVHKGEKQLQGDLRRMGLVQGRDNDTPTCVQCATPDVLLKERVTIADASVKWIECKRCVLVPELSSAHHLDALMIKIRKYVQLYGSGIVYWAHSCDFSESIRAFVNAQLQDDGVAWS